MNGKFKTILFGFKRRDVIDYIKAVSSEKGRLEEENTRLTNELCVVKDELESLKAASSDSAQRLETLEASLEETRRLLSASEGELELASEESTRLKKQLYSLAQAVSSGCSVSDAELQDMSGTLSGIAMRLKECLAPVKESLSGVYDTIENTEAAE